MCVYLSSYLTEAQTHFVIMQKKKQTKTSLTPDQLVAAKTYFFIVIGLAPI